MDTGFLIRVLIAIILALLTLAILYRRIAPGEFHSLPWYWLFTSAPFFATFICVYEATHYLLNLNEPPTAIFACNDLMAVGAGSNALELGMKIPEDLSIIGFDDVRLAAYANPPISTISQPKYEMGVLTTQMLLTRMQEPAMPPQTQILTTQLVVCRSTAPRKVR